MHSTQTLIVSIVVSAVVTLVLAVGGLAASQSSHHSAVPSTYVAPVAPPVVHSGESPETACIARGSNWYSPPYVPPLNDPEWHSWNGACS